MPLEHPIMIKGIAESLITLENVLDEIPMGVMVFGPDRRVMLVNRALEAMTGFLAQEASGVQCHYVLRSNLCCHGCRTEDVKNRGESMCSEANIVNKNRQKIPVRLTVAPIMDANGQLAAFIESVEDTRCYGDQCSWNSDSFLAGNLIGMSPEMQRILKIIPIIGQTDSSVLITGQTGTGKDVVAEAIHQASSRAKGPFIKINCGALPEALLESELFGHQKGAFTGAIENKPGRFRLAQNGTVYLTEIGDLPLNLQVKLLSFLDDKIVHPLGSTKGHHVDVRVIAATHRNLEKMVREGRFREDLLFRLNVVRIQLPPLAKRGDDSKMLLDHFLQNFNSRFGKKIRGFSNDARQALFSYPFPGNVRELRNIVEYAVNVCEVSSIQLAHLPAYILEGNVRDQPSDIIETNGLAASTPADSGPAGDATWVDTERKLILDAMVRAQGRKSAAAEILGCCRSTLWRKLKRHGIVA